MDCREVRERLEDYADGELTAADALALERHLADCAACRAEWERLQLVIEAVETWPLVAEPSTLTAQVMRQVRRPSAAPPAARFPWRDLLVGLGWTGLAYLVLSSLFHLPVPYPVDWLLGPARAWLNMSLALHRLGLDWETVLIAALLLGSLTALALERPAVPATAIPRRK